MSEKVKKKPLFISVVRWNSQKSTNEAGSPPSPVPPGPSTPGGSMRASPVHRAKMSITEPKPRRHSSGGIKELVQCPLCLEVLHNPKMLPCQHTFCFACLTVFIQDQPIIECPTCHTRIQITSPSYVDNLPPNLYIDSLLQLVGKASEPDEQQSAKEPPTPNKMQSVELHAGGARCSQCKTMCDSSDITNCEHCKQRFCRVCWSRHLHDMHTQLGAILKQLDSAANRLDHKIENYKDRCEHLLKQINKAADEKISTIISTRDKLLLDASNLHESGDARAMELKTLLDDARKVTGDAVRQSGSQDEDRVTTFMKVHQHALRLLSNVSKWGTERVVFDAGSFAMELESAAPTEAESEEPLPGEARQDNPLASEDSLVLHYRSRNFIPHYVWRKAARPAGVAVSPWHNHLYICGMDTHSVLVVERTQGRIVARLTCEDMLCPVHIAFMNSLHEIYVTDKWKHCVHVFSKDGEHLRSFGHKGSRPGAFRSPEGIATDNANRLVYVADTGNDRVQVLQPDGKFVSHIGVVTKQQVVHSNSVEWQTKRVTCTELNEPTAVAVTHDRVIILDSGNFRVKMYNKLDNNKIVEFGSVGQRKGQFRQPEVLTVDPMGFIIVGDSGNARVQVFKPTGQLVRVFGSHGVEAGKYGWISGIHVTKELDIIISDSKNHCVNFI